MSGKRQGWLTALVAVLVLASVSGTALSQAAAEGEMTLAQKWKDFIHYVNIGQADMARSFGQAILESQAEPREVYKLANATVKIDEALARGEQLKGMVDVIKRVRKMIRDGFQAEAANPEEIAKSIKLLGGTLTQFNEGRRRIETSGEYALPQLIQKLSATDTTSLLRERIVVVLPSIGLVGVRGMSVALQTDNPTVQEALANALRKIGYPLAAPRLKELADRKDILSRVRTAAVAALIECGGRGAADKSLAELYYELAEKYYHRAESLRPDPRYDKANVWTWGSAKGLGFTPVPRQIFCDIYAMRMARLALKNDTSSGKALSLWLASGLKRQADLPEGATDPLKGSGDARYYALAAGPRFLLSVLDRGLTEDDAPVSLGAIEALAETGGAASIVKQITGGIQPLVKALSFPDRHVRFLAASALADSMPTKDFEGSAFVMTVINEALRQKGKKAALLVTDTAQANQLKDAVLAAGYEVIAGASAIKTLAAGRNSSGIDMVVLTSRPDPGPIVETLRADAFYRSVPIVVLFQSADLRRQAKEDGRIILLPAGADATAIGEGMRKASVLGVGKPLTSEEADAWIVRLSKSVRMLGLTGNTVHDVRRSLKALAGNTRSENAAVQIAAVDALAVMDVADAQKAIAQLACSNAAQPVRLAAFSALAQSLRRFGNKVPPAESKAILDVVNGTDPLEVRQGAAKALGAQNLSSDQIKSMILGAK